MDGPAVTDTIFIFREGYIMRFVEPDSIFIEGDPSYVFRLEQGRQEIERYMGTAPLGPWAPMREPLPLPERVAPLTLPPGAGKLAAVAAVLGLAASPYRLSRRALLGLSWKGNR